MDELLATQAVLTEKMGKNTASFMSNDDMNGVSIVSEFMDENSPSKRSKYVADSDDSDDSVKETDDAADKEDESNVSK